MAKRAFALSLFLFYSSLVGIASGRLHFTTPEYVVHVWETKDGLPENSATAMTQTPDGYLWFGTFNGLVRFDGMEMKVFDRSTTPELPSAAVINVYTDKAGRLWVSTDLGLAYLDNKGKWRHIGKDEGWTGTYAKSFTEDKNGQLIFGTEDQKLFRLAGDKVELIPPPPDLPKTSFFCHFDSEGVLWLAGKKYLGRWAADHWERTLPAAEIGAFKCAAPSRDGGLWFYEMESLRKFVGGKETARILPPPGTDPWSLFEDSQGSVWISTYFNGLFRYRADGGWTHYSNTNGLTYNAGRFTFEDREGNYWVGTSGGGLHRFKSRIFQSFAPNANEFQLGRVIKSIIETSPDHYFTATFGEGILRFENGEFSKSGLPPSTYHYRTNCFPIPYIGTMAVDAKGLLWIGSIDGIYFWDGKDKVRSGLTNQEIYAILRDRSGRMWVGGNKGLASSENGIDFKFYGPESGLTARNIRCLADDPHSDCLWVGTDDGGLFSLKAGRFRRFSSEDGLESEQIRSAYVDRKGVLWVGTQDKGLARYDKHQFNMIGEGIHLLTARQINTIMEDDEGFLWLGSNRGIIRAHRSDLEAVASGQTRLLKSRTFDYNDGLLSVEVPSGYQNCGMRDSAGRLWFCTMKGVAMIDPSRIRFSNNPPRPHVEKMSYYVPVVGKSGTSGQNERNVELDAPFSSVLKLPPGSRRIEFHYTGLNFSAPEKVLYQYIGSSYSEIM